MPIRTVLAGFKIEDTVDGAQILKNLERYGRLCKKSEGKITEGSAEKLIRQLIKDGHESVLEHEKVTVRFIIDRGVSHELVRHRIGSYSQESTRYCNYGRRGIEFIQPFFLLGGEHVKRYNIWLRVMEACEKGYLEFLEDGASLDEARIVLPFSLKTEIVVTYNLRAWRHFFRLRASNRAHPQMREVVRPLLARFKALIPVIFDDISGE